MREKLELLEIAELVVERCQVEAQTAIEHQALQAGFVAVHRFGIEIKAGGDLADIEKIGVPAAAIEAARIFGVDVDIVIECKGEPGGRGERSEGSRVGKECVSTCSSRWSTYN